MDAESLSAAVEARRDLVLEVLAELVRAARGGHDAVQDHVADVLRGAGADVAVVEYRPRDVTVGYEIGAPSTLEGALRYVVGRYGRSEQQVLFWAHSDSEPVDGSGWTRPLFDAVVDGGRMYGWGIGDDLVGVAMMLAAARLHHDTGLLDGRSVAFASVPSKQRAQAIIHALDNGVGGVGSVYLHPAESGAGLGEIKAIASGLLRFHVRVHGRRPDTTEPGHTVFLHTAVDPLPIAARVIEALRALGEQRARSVYYAPVHDVIGRSTNVHVSHVEAGRRERLSQVPTTVDLYGSMTFPPSEPMADAQAALEQALDAVMRNDPWLAERPLELAWLVGIQGAETGTDAAVYRATHDAIVATTGAAPHVNALHAASDIRNPVLHAGMPTVGIGPLVGDLTVSGGVDEWADVDDYMRGVEVVLRIARSFGDAA